MNADDTDNVVGDFRFFKGNIPYVSPTPGEISVCASTVIPDGEMPTREQLTEFSNCGFNVFIQNNSSDVIYDSLFRCLSGMRLKLILSNTVLRGSDYRRCRQFIERFRSQPNLGGWEMQDEPKYIDLDRQKKILDVILGADSSHFIHINLVGELVEPFVGNSRTMFDYLRHVQRILKPGLWSYDFYPIRKLADDRIDVNRDVFYSDLESFSKISILTQRPFWAYCQSVGFRTGGVIKPTPKEEYLRYEAFSALAYGAQGLVYWTYFRRKENMTDKYETFEAPVGWDYKKTKVWYYVRNVNREIKKYNDVFLGCKLVDVVHTGEKQYKGTRMMSGPFGPLESMSTAREGVLVSHIRTLGKDYLVIVNHDVERRQQLFLKFKRGIEVKDMSDGRILTSGGGVKRMNLSPGGYIILSWK